MTELHTPSAVISWLPDHFSHSPIFFACFTWMNLACTWHPLLPLVQREEPASGPDLQILGAAFPQMFSPFGPPRRQAPSTRRRIVPAKVQALDVDPRFVGPPSSGTWAKVVSPKPQTQGVCGCSGPINPMQAPCCH